MLHVWEGTGLWFGCRWITHRGTAVPMLARAENSVRGDDGRGIAYARVGSRNAAGGLVILIELDVVRGINCSESLQHCCLEGNEEERRCVVLVDWGTTAEPDPILSQCPVAHDWMRPSIERPQHTWRRMAMGCRPQMVFSYSAR